MKRAGVVLILVLAFAGLADSAYLAQHEVAGAPLLCDVRGLSGCNTVVESPYSKLFGISTADYGILFYAIVFAAAALELALFDRVLRRALQILGAIGVIASLYFVAIQVFLIHALCIYCLASAVLALAVGLAASLLEPVRRPVPPSPLIGPA